MLPVAFGKVPQRVPGRPYLHDKVRVPASEPLPEKGSPPRDLLPSEVPRATPRVPSSYFKINVSIPVCHPISPNPRSPQARILASHISSWDPDDGEPLHDRRHQHAFRAGRKSRELSLQTVPPRSPQ